MKRPRRGFTLLELIVVLCIISVLSALAAPRLAGRGQAAVLRGAGYDLQTLAATARTRALLSGREVALQIETGGGGELRLLSRKVVATGDGVIDIAPPRRLPQGLSAQFFPHGDGGGEQILFRPDGSAGGGELRISDRRGGELRLRLVEPLGRLQLAQAP